jgi:hypothetical protein
VHHPTPIVIFFVDGFGGFGCCFCYFGGFGGFWVMSSWGASYHSLWFLSNLVVFDGFGGFARFVGFAGFGGFGGFA